MQRKRVLRWLGIAVGLLVFGLVLRQVHGYRAELRLSWARLDAPSIALALLAFALAQALYATCWHRLLSGDGRRDSLRGDVARWCVSMAGKYFPGKVWQAVARYGLYHGGPERAKVAPAYAREMLLSLSAAMALVAAPGLIGGTGPASLALPFSLGAALLFLLAMPAVSRWALVALRRWTPLHLDLPASAPMAVVEAWLLQLAAYVVLGLGLLALAHGLGLPATGLAVPMVAAFCFAGLAGIAAFFVPAGIGVREAALAWYLAPLLGAGPAALLAIAARVWISVGEAALVAAGLYLLRDEASRTAGEEGASRP